MIEKMSFNQLIRLRQNAEYFGVIQRRFDSVNKGNIIAVSMCGSDVF